MYMYLMMKQGVHDKLKLKDKTKQIIKSTRHRATSRRIDDTKSKQSSIYTVIILDILKN